MTEGDATGPTVREQPLLITHDMLAPGSLAGRVDFESGMRLAPPLVMGLIIVLVLVFLWEVGSGALDDADAIVAAGALVRERVRAGEAWRLLSATFLHGGLDHLIGNCIALYIVGIGCEHALGVLPTALVYSASALAGSALSALFSPGPSVGASGAIFGVLGALAVVLLRNRHRFHLRDKRVGVVLAAWAAYQIATGLLTPFVDNLAHVGGLLAGALVALPMHPRLLRHGC